MRASKPSRVHPASMSRSGTAPASAEALDNGEDPQRASLVETRHRRLAREFEHAVERPVARRSSPADVVRQVEIRVDEPA